MSGESTSGYLTIWLSVPLAGDDPFEDVAVAFTLPAPAFGRTVYRSVSVDFVPTPPRVDHVEE
jgi:hypothetical protein